MVSALHNFIRTVLQEGLRNMGFETKTEETIGHKRVDLYAKKDNEELVIEVITSGGWINQENGRKIIRDLDLNNSKIILANVFISLQSEYPIHVNLPRLEGNMLTSQRRKPTIGQVRERLLLLIATDPEGIRKFDCRKISTKTVVLNNALQGLIQMNAIKFRKDKHTGGRPATLYFVTDEGRKLIKKLNEKRYSFPPI